MKLPHLEKRRTRIYSCIENRRIWNKKCGETIRARLTENANPTERRRRKAMGLNQATAAENSRRTFDE